MGVQCKVVCRNGESVKCELLEGELLKVWLVKGCF